MKLSLLQFTLELARETGDMLLENYFYNPNLKASLKSDQTVVTEADLAANQHIQTAIRAAYPNDHILSEEANMTYPDSNIPTWVIDPIDGTTNFNLGLHHWGVSIARMTAGMPDLGVIYFPVLHELYHATAGEGAFMNGQPIHTRPYQPGQPSVLFVRDTRMYEFFKGNLGIKARILGSAAYNICAVARGIAVAGFESTPKIWDLAASWLVLMEAGGKTHFYQGDIFPARTGLDYESTYCPILFAADQDTVDKGRAAIQPK